MFVNFFFLSFFLCVVDRRQDFESSSAKSITNSSAKRFWSFNGLTVQLDPLSIAIYLTQLLRGESHEEEKTF